ncbi:FAD:protein FMN transferase [bacterium]|nr:FAD:protein FMN transferase [bacterium]
MHGHPLIARLPESGGFPVFGFSHKAMATVFEILIRHPDAAYARKAAFEAFLLIDRLEGEFSRFIPNSGVSRINHAGVREPVQAGADLFECLCQAMAAWERTGGAFDVTAGFFKGGRDGKDREGSETAIGMDALVLDKSGLCITKTRPVMIDLGGIGKGYALDRAAGLLQEWDVETVFLHGGTSSVLARGCPDGCKGWEVTISHPGDRGRILQRFVLRNRSVSGSGVEKGFHIIDPAHRIPAREALAAWAEAGDAALADALSTAFMVMEWEDVKRLCSDDPELKAVVVKQDGAVLSVI